MDHLVLIEIAILMQHRNIFWRLVVILLLLLFILVDQMWRSLRNLISTLLIRLYVHHFIQFNIFTQHA